MLVARIGKRFPLHVHNVGEQTLDQGGSSEPNKAP